MWEAALSIPTHIVLEGGPNDTWIFQVHAALDMTAGVKMVMRGGALAKNVFWQVQGAVTLGAGAPAQARTAGSWRRP